MQSFLTISFNLFILLSLSILGCVPETSDLKKGVRISFPNNEHYISKIIKQKDGKILLGGTIKNPSEHDLLLIRFNPDGSYDQSFGKNGLLQIGGEVTDESLISLDLLEDGKILIGSNSGMLSGMLQLYRLNANGSLDKTFGTFGSVTTPGDHHLRNSGVVKLLNDGTILVVGALFDSVTYNPCISVVMVDKNGQVDQTIGNSGLKHFKENYQRYVADDACISPNGQLQIIGSMTSAGGNFVIQLNKNLEPVQDFKYNHQLLEKFDKDNYVRQMMALEDSSTLIALNGYDAVKGYSIQLLKIDAKGEFVKEFGEKGVFQYVFPQSAHIHHIEKSKDGNLAIVAVSEIKDPGEVSVLSLDQKGRLNERFGKQGIYTTTFDHLYGVAYNAEDPNVHYTAVRQSYEAGSVTVLRRDSVQ